MLDAAFEALLPGVSAFCALTELELRLELELPSLSRPAAPPQAVKTRDKIMPQAGSLTGFSARESIFLYH